MSRQLRKFQNPVVLVTHEHAPVRHVRVSHAHYGCRRKVLQLSQFKTVLLGLPLLLLAGCFTLTETPYPETAMTRPAATNATLAVRGFEARVTEFVSVHGVSTVYVDDWRGGWWYGPGYWETVPVSATVARPRETDAFRERARDRFEEAGWSVMAQVPEFLVEVKFTGAEEESGAFWRRALRVVGTLFLSDRAALVCRARLKIYDNRSGKLLFTRDYEETLEESMWSPLPVLGPLSYDKTTFDYMHARCLQALTDRTTADASAYLAGGLR